MLFFRINVRFDVGLFVVPDFSTASVTLANSSSRSFSPDLAAEILWETCDDGGATRVRRKHARIHFSAQIDRHERDKRQPCSELCASSARAR